MFNILTSMQPTTFFLIYILLGFLTAYMASKKNRNPIGWFFTGMFFGVFGIIILLTLPPLSHKDTHLNLPDENNLSNNALNSFLENTSPTEASSSIDRVEISTEKWFYLNKDKQAVGPLSFEDLLLFLHAKAERTEEDVTPQNIWVWKKGMQNWEKVKNVPEINNALKAFN